MAPLGLFFSIFPLFSLQPPTNAQTCTSVNCGDVIVEFPFRLPDQPDCCGNPNFNLSCRANRYFHLETFITFPLAGEFRVDDVGYSMPNLLISDPEGCTPKRLLQGIDLSGTPFELRYPESYLFLNCSSNVSGSLDYPAINFDCLSGENFSVVAIPTIFYNQSSPLQSCGELATIMVPLETPDSPEYYLDGLLLTWEQPDCSSSCNCENRGRSCLEDDYNCSSDKKKGLSKGSKYGLILGLGVPIFFLLAVFMIYYNAKGNHGDHQRQQHPSAQIPRLAGPNLAAAAMNGLDRSRIEAYPITLLGESFQLPRPNDNTCSICLSEYKAKETMRTITDCDHYFHSNCIDEWLKLNATCPVCRNTPDKETTLSTHSGLSSSSPS